jgi:Metallo-peptidase family M12
MDWRSAAWRSAGLWAAIAAFVVARSPIRASADVVVISNRSHEMIRFSVGVVGSEKRDYRLQSGDLVPIPVPAGREAAVAFFSGGEPKSYLLESNAPYFFFDNPKTKKLELEQIGLSRGQPAADAPSAEGNAAGGTAGSNGARNPALQSPPMPAGAPAVGAKDPGFTKVTVKILVDEEEPAVRHVWEERLKKRVAAASEILERYGRIKLEVVATDTWKSDNTKTDDASADFDRSLREFQIKVRPQPAQIAIGFTSQYQVSKGRTHLGGTRGPLMSHILLREWSKRVSEPERLELLVHELGHHFGASHSPEHDSVMRPVLGDRQSVARSFRIAFDPLNTLAMNLVSEEIRDRGITSYAGIRPSVRRRLVDVYATLGRMMPEDPAAGVYLQRLGEAPVVQLQPQKKSGNPLVDGPRLVIAAVVEAAGRNRSLPHGLEAGAGPVRPSGDALTEQYVRAAAAAASQLPAEERAKALCLGLAVALGDVDSLTNNPLTKDLLPLLETDERRKVRLALIGSPTMHGRDDLTRHFFISAGVASLAGPEIAESIGLLKEFRDANGGSGFSFVDLSADLAGVAFAKQVQSADGLKQVADSFRVAQVLPPIDGLPEGLQLAKFQESFGSPSDPRFRAEVDKLRARLRALDPSKATAATIQPKADGKANPSGGTP